MSKVIHSKMEKSIAPLDEKWDNLSVSRSETIIITLTRLERAHNELMDAIWLEKSPDKFLIENYMLLKKLCLELGTTLEDLSKGEKIDLNW